MSQVELGFLLESLSMPIDKILPSRQVPEGLLISRKFAQIKASIEAVGLIEPLSVGKLDKGKRVLLDGHIRLIALRDLGYTEVTCLESKDDESFTYNNRINRLSTIQEHHMLRRAVERGVSAERLAVALDIDVNTINKKMTLLDGLCTEVVDLLKDPPDLVHAHHRHSGRILNVPAQVLVAPEHSSATTRHHRFQAKQPTKNQTVRLKAVHGLWTTLS